MRALARGITLGALLVMASEIAAQDGATLAGRIVHKTARTGIQGAEVVLNPRGTQQLSDAEGRFRFEQVAPGIVAIVVRRLGFTPETLSVDVQRADRLLDVEIELTEAIQSLDTVNVAARNDPIPRGTLSGFYERKRFGIGRFIEAKDIDRLNHRLLADVLIGRLPGVRAIRAAGGSSVFIATSRMTLRIRGRSPQYCLADVYLDGVIVYSGRMPPFDINTIDPKQVAGIEFYSGPGQIPAQYNKTGSACGVLLIWTK